MSAAEPFQYNDFIKVIKLLNGRPLAIRNKAFLALGHATGYRCNELLSIRRKDLLDPTGKIRKKLTIYCTKNKKIRSVELTPIVKPFLIEWLQELEKAGYQLPNHKVFISLN